MKVAKIDDVKAAFEKYCGALNMGLVDSIIKNLPTQELSEDAVEVVRCKDCRYSGVTSSFPFYRYCIYDMKLQRHVEDSGYCDLGHRRE